MEGVANKLANKKSSENLRYLVTCEMRNGNVIPAFTDSFSLAMEIAARFESGDYTKKVKIFKISSGAMFEYIF